MNNLEDQHIQMVLKDNDFGAEIKQLLDFDLILRTNDSGTKYVGFEIFNYEKQESEAYISFNNVCPYCDGDGYIFEVPEGGELPELNVCRTCNIFDSIEEAQKFHDLNNR